MNLQGFGYTFPFPIICSVDVVSWPSLSRTIDGIKIEIQPPFLSGENIRITQDFSVNNSPSFKRRGIAVHEAEAPLRSFRTIPQCFNGESVEPPPQCEVNALQIEVQSRSETRAESIEAWFVRSGLRNLRRLSGQFWIEHPAIYFEGFRRVQYKVESGKLDHGIWATSTFYSGNLQMQVIDFAKWKSAWLSAKKEYNSDYADSLLLAEHQVAGAFLFDAVMSCALAIERSKYALWEKFLYAGKCSPSQEKAARNDTSRPQRYFSELLPEGISLPRISREELESISKVWIARGLIAHGKEKDLPKILGTNLDNQIVTAWISNLWKLGNEIDYIRI